jgi:hypothetical protein
MSFGSQTVERILAFVSDANDGLFERQRRNRGVKPGDCVKGSPLEDVAPGKAAKQCHFSFHVFESYTTCCPVHLQLISCSPPSTILLAPYSSDSLVHGLPSPVSEYGKNCGYPISQRFHHETATRATHLPVHGNHYSVTLGICLSFDRGAEVDGGHDAVSELIKQNAGVRSSFRYSKNLAAYLFSDKRLIRVLSHHECQYPHREIRTGETHAVNDQHLIQPIQDRIFRRPRP